MNNESEWHQLINIFTESSCIFPRHERAWNGLTSQNQVSGSCERGYKSLGSIRCVEFLETTGADIILKHWEVWFPRVRPTRKTSEGSLLRDDDTPQKSESQQKPTEFLDDSTATSTLQSDCHMSGRFKKECLLNTITAMQHCRRPCARGCRRGRETFTEREIHVLALKFKLSPWFDVCSLSSFG